MCPNADLVLHLALRSILVQRNVHHHDRIVIAILLRAAIGMVGKVAGVAVAAVAVVVLSVLLALRLGLLRERIAGAAAAAGILN